MQIKKNVIKATIAGGVMLASAGAASAGAAFAAQATATANVNVRSGPGGDYSVVDTVRRGDRVEVQECQAGWCYVQKRGPDGWVSSTYLSLRGQGGQDGSYNGGSYSVSPGVTLEFNFNTAPPPRPQPQPVHPRPPRPDHGGWNGNGGWDGGWQGGGRDRDRGDRWDRNDRWDNGPRRDRDWN